MSLLFFTIVMAGVGTDQPHGDALAQVFEYLSVEQVIDAEVSASTKAGQRIFEAPAIVSLINSDYINSYGWLSLNDILYRQPGFAPAQDYERRIVQGRGQLESWANDHMLLLVDGVPMNEEQWGSAITWDATSLMFVKSVEIVRGPASSLYGSNAMSGVIAITTVDSPNDKGSVEGKLWLGNAASARAQVLGRFQTSLVAGVLGASMYTTAGNVVNVADGSGLVDPSGQVQFFPEQDARAGHYVYGKFDRVRGVPGLTLSLHYQHFSNQTGHGWLWNISPLKDVVQFQRVQAIFQYATQTGNLKQQYALSLSHEDHLEVLHLVRPNEYSTLLPAGVNENEHSLNNKIFARAQLSYAFSHIVEGLLGAEYGGFLRGATIDHELNLLPPNNILGQTGEMFKVGDYMPSLGGRAVSNLGLLAQLRSLPGLTNCLSVTASARYDLEYFPYRTYYPYATLIPTLGPWSSRTIQQVSPRLGVVLMPSDTLSFKLLGAHAIRTPAPSELFGGQSYILYGSPTTQQPETVNTYELAVDWRIFPGLSLRADGFYKQFDNLIGITGTNYLFTTFANIYSNTTTGTELELAFELPPMLGVRVDGFVNATYVKQLSESVSDPLFVTPMTDLTWSPAWTANLGARVIREHALLSLQVHYQGEVLRRASDRQTPLYIPYRPDTVAPWVTLDVRLAYTVFDWMRLGVQASNVLNTAGDLVKIRDFPFDYHVEGPRVFGTLELTSG